MRGPKESTSYRDGVVADCPVRAAGLLGGPLWFDVRPVWQAARRAAAAYAKQLLRKLSISVANNFSPGCSGRKRGDPGIYSSWRIGVAFRCSRMTDFG
jgi:hypothetical protein